MKRHGIVNAAVACAVVFGLGSDAHAAQTVGWIEKVKIAPGNLELVAKVDSGADNSSINAEDIRIFRRNGQKLVRFTVRNKQGGSVTLERPLVRIAKIKGRVDETGKRAEPRRRPVVVLGICMAGVYKEAHVNLTDRRHFKYPMLIGRSYMGSDFLIDPSKKLTAHAICAEVPDK
jgi:hypothetical protein